MSRSKSPNTWTFDKGYKVRASGVVRWNGCFALQLFFKSQAHTRMMRSGVEVNGARCRKSCIETSINEIASFTIALRDNVLWSFEISVMVNHHLHFPGPFSPSPSRPRWTNTTGRYQSVRISLLQPIWGVLFLRCLMYAWSPHFSPLHPASSWAKSCNKASMFLEGFKQG